MLDILLEEMNHKYSDLGEIISSTMSCTQQRFQHPGAEGLCPQSQPGGVTVA